ncbi:MAG: DUF86 domain-containing protein [Candidatus Firestonebacteria bacterium]|nr:DUF86 domain-containing protein [Candidatus Firestonebacteria bacterium]
MVKEIIKSQSIIPRIDGIQRDIEKLRKLVDLPFEEFEEESNFIKSQFYLRQALEGVFHIGSHILARIPGGRASEYKEIALKLGVVGIIDKNYAENNLKAMAGYRNRLTHFYADISPKEIYKILKENLNDFNVFLEAIKKFLQNLEKFNLIIE